MMPFAFAPPARIDGGEGLCVFYRQYCTSGLHTVGNFDATVGEWKGYKNGHHPGQFSQTFGGAWVSNGNFCKSGSFGHYDPESRSNVYAPHAIIPTTVSPTLTVMSVGDSILSGVSSRGEIDRGINSVGLQLVKMLNKSSRPVLHRNGAVSGMANADYIADALISIAVSVPDIILLEPYSPNDPDSTRADVVWTEFQRSMSFAACAADLGVAVILMTNVPYAGLGSSRAAAHWEASRCHANRRIKVAGLPVIDADLVLGTGSSPVSYMPGCSNDFIHPSDAGAQLLALDSMRLLKRAYGIS